MNVSPDPSAAHSEQGFHMDEAQEAMRRMLEEQAAATDRLVQELQRRERDRKRLEKSVETILEHEEIPESLPHIIAASEEEYQKLEAELEDRTARLQAQVQAHELELYEKEREIGELRKMRKTIQEQELLIQNLRRLLQSKEQSLTDVLDALEQQGEEIQGIQQALHANEQEMGRRSELLARQARSLQLLQKEVGQLEARVRRTEELERELQDAESRHRADREALDRAQAEYGALQAERTRLQRELQEFQEAQSQDAQEQARRAVERELAALREELSRVREEAETGRAAADDLKRLGKVLLKKDKQLKEARAEAERLQSQAGAGGVVSPPPAQPREELDWRALAAPAAAVEQALARARRGETELPRWDEELLTRAGLLEDEAEPAGIFGGAEPVIEVSLIDDVFADDIPAPPPPLEAARHEEMAAVEPVFDLPTIARPARRKPVRVARPRPDRRPARPAPPPVTPPRATPRMASPAPTPQPRPPVEIPLQERAQLPEPKPTLWDRLLGRSSAPAEAPEFELVPEFYEPAPPAEVLEEATALPFDEDDLWAPQEELGLPMDEPDEEWQVAPRSQKWRPGRAMPGAEPQSPPAAPADEAARQAGEEPAAAGRDWRNVLRRFRPVRMGAESLVPEAREAAEPGTAQPAGLEQDQEMRQLKEKIDALARSLRTHKETPEADAAAPAPAAPAAPVAAAGLEAQIEALLVRQSEETDALQARLRAVESRHGDEMAGLRAELAEVGDETARQEIAARVQEREHGRTAEVQHLRQQLQALYTQHSEQVRELRGDLQRHEAELEIASPETAAEAPPEDAAGGARLSAAAARLHQTIREREERIERDIKELVEELKKAPVPRAPEPEPEVSGPAAAEPEAALPRPPKSTARAPEQKVHLERELSAHSEQVKLLRGDLQQKAAELAKALQQIQGEAVEAPSPSADVEALRRSIREREQQITQELQELSRSADALHPPLAAPPPAPVAPAGEQVEEQLLEPRATLWDRLLAGFRRAETAGVATRGVYLLADPAIARAWQPGVAEFLATHGLAAQWRAADRPLAAADWDLATDVVYLYPQADWQPLDAVEQQAAARGIAFHQWPLRTLARLEIDLMDQVIGYEE